jgi:hypothetical protein
MVTFDVRLYLTKVGFLDLFRFKNSGKSMFSFQ